MVVSGLSGKFTYGEEPVETAIEETQESSELKDIIDPDNPNIITTTTELTLFEKIKQITGCDEIEYKDTESYFGVLYQGKVNRWIVRFYDKKNSAYIMVPIEITDLLGNEIKRAGLELTNNRITVQSPEDILRITGIILDSFEYVKNDENFRKKQSGE